MKTVTLSRWSLPALVAALVAAVALVLSMQTAQADTLVTVHVKQASVADHAKDCPGSVTGAHFIINQIGSAAPASITVWLADGQMQIVPKSKQSGPTAHYDSFFTGTLVSDATAMVPSSWTGQFVLSNYFCGSTTSSTTSSSSSSSGTSGTQSSPPPSGG